MAARFYINERENEMMIELKRDLVMILSTEAQNQRTPPIDYVIAEDGGRMVHRPEPDIAMAELLEEAAAALASERAAHAETKRELADLKDEWEAEYETRLQYQTRLRGTEARLAEAMKALGLIDALDPEGNVYGCTADALRGLVIQMGQIARRALTGAK